MKKRFLSLLLALCMVVALFTCLGVSASADGDTFTYTVKNGDSLWAICAAKKLNYYTCKNAIMSLNGFTSEYKLSHISVGDTITLPSSDAVAQTLSASGSTTTSTTTTTSGSTTTTTTTTTNSLANGDVVSYYLISHTMASGETVQAIYNSWGLNYKTYSDQILAVNGLSGYNKMYAGKAYLFPSPTVPAGSTAAYSIIAHKVVSKDSAYNLCNTYGTNYNKTLTVVKAVNGGSNLTTIKVGQVIYIPASGAVGTAASGGTASGGTSGGTSVGTVVGTTAYNINKTTAKNGSFITKSGSSEITSAKSGSSVMVVTTPAAGYVVDSIVVSKTGDSTTTVATNSSVFTMPAYAVDVKVTFKLGSTVVSGTAHKISVSATGGTVSTIANGAAVTTAKAGTFVTVVPTPNKGYTLDSIKVSYNNYASNVPVSSNAFNMPDQDVNVVVTFSALPTYKISLVTNIKDGPGCTFSAKVDGANVTKAVAGEKVTIAPVPASGYAVDQVIVTYADGSAVSMTDAYSFVMPAQAVRIRVTFAASYNLKTTASNASVSYLVNGVAVTKAVAGATVKFTPKPKSGYTIGEVKMNNTVLTPDADGVYTFEMPAAVATVTIATAEVATYKLTDASDANGSLKFKVNGGYVTKAAAGETVTIVPVAKDGFSMTAASYTSTAIAAAVTADADGVYSFKMPAADTTVNADFTAIAKRTVSVNFDANVSKITLLVDGKAIDAKTTSSVQNTYEIIQGKNVTVEVVCAEGYTLNEVTSSDVTVNDADIFTVGSKDIVVNVSSRGQYRSISANAPANGDFTLVDAYGTLLGNTAAAGSTVYILPQPDKNYEVDSMSYSYLSNGKVIKNSISKATDNTYGFTMPGADVTLEISFKAKTLSIKTVTLTAPTAATGVSLRIEAGGTKYASGPIAVKANDTVKILPAITNVDYKVSSVEVFYTNASSAKVSIKDKVSFTAESDGSYTFKMPTDYTDLIIEVTVVAK